MTTTHHVISKGQTVHKPQIATFCMGGCVVLLPFSQNVIRQRKFDLSKRFAADAPMKKKNNKIVVLPLRAL